MDELSDQAGMSHWAARTEALDRLLQLLTAEGGSSDSDVGNGGEGGRFVLESRPASRRLEAVIAERARDANFRVAAAALKLLSGLVEAHPALMASHASALLPSVSRYTICSLLGACSNRGSTLVSTVWRHCERETMQKSSRRV